MSESVDMKSVTWTLRTFFAAWIACVVGVITLFIYPLQGIGIILLAGFLLHSFYVDVVVERNNAMSRKLTEIIGQLDEYQDEGLTRGTLSQGRAEEAR